MYDVSFNLSNLRSPVIVLVLVGLGWGGRESEGGGGYVNMYHKFALLCGNVLGLLRESTVSVLFCLYRSVTQLSPIGHFCLYVVYSWCTAHML